MCQKKIPHPPQPMVTENSFMRNNSLYFPLCFLQGEMVPTPTTEPATWPTQWHSTAEIKTNFMIVVQIIKSPAGFPSKMKAHLFSEVYNLVVNVSFGPKHPKLGFCLEHITTLWEKSGPRVVPLCLSIQGTVGLKMTFCCFISGNSSHWVGLGGPGFPLDTIASKLRFIYERAGSPTTCMDTCFCISQGWGEWITMLSAILGFSSRFLWTYSIFSKIILKKKVHPASTNIWIKTKPDSFQGSWADHMYLEPKFSLSSLTNLTQIEIAISPT